MKEGEKKRLRLEWGRRDTAVEKMKQEILN